MGRFTYKNYCWSLGTTSFRTENFNRTIELQLQHLKNFWELEENANFKWNGNSVLQSNYYDFLKDKNFIEGDANNKAKDAREKTSGLVDLGLIYEDRKLTQSGLKIVEISKMNDFSIDNSLKISKDSYLYLKQLLKMSIKIDNGFVRPLIVLLYFLSKFNSISKEIFTYLIPLCTNEQYMLSICNDIEQSNKTTLSIDDIIIKRLNGMDNYKDALEFFINEKVIDENIICSIGMNRKSPKYDIPYFELYESLKDIILDKKHNAVAIIRLFNAIKNIKIKTLWLKHIFQDKKQITIKYISKELVNSLNIDNSLFKATNEIEFKKAFFWTMHLLKAKATLKDYADLNRRYFGLSDIFIFRDDKVELDIVPKYFFNSVINDLLKDAFELNDKLGDDCELNEINNCLALNENILINSINQELGLDLKTLDEANFELDKHRYERFNDLIDEKFTDEAIITLLKYFENRNDNKIKSYTTNNADIPTIFEYILGIAWYKISERQGRILDYMKLSLDADLLPKSHAVGGDADIVYEYDDNKAYPKHTLLLEATLADRTNQRRMEMEPVSRHLGKYLLKNKSKHSYCIFLTTYLDVNVLSDFRHRKEQPYYDTSDPIKYVNGMKITPLSTDNLRTIIQNNKKYSELYSIFEQAHQMSISSEPNAFIWHKNNIIDKL